MVPTVDLKKVVGSTVHAKYINVMAEVECNILYSSQKNVKAAEGAVVDVDDSN